MTPTLEQLITQIDRADLEEILTEVCTKANSRFKQELLSQIDEHIDEAIRKFRDVAVHRSWKTAQNWCKWGDDGPILMPDFTRIYYRRGQTEVVLQEFAPQIRLMKFTTDLACRECSDDPRPEEGVRAYSLALPYLVFIFQFNNGLYNQSILAFNDRPLKDLKEKPLCPYLSNIDSGLKLCLGYDFNENALVKGQIAQQIAYILGHFWQTVYSDEWSAHYWNSKKNFAEDQRLKDLESWQNASMENPLFVVEDAGWLPHDTIPSFGKIISSLFGHDTDDSKFQASLYDDIIDTLSNEIKSVVIDRTQAADPQLKATNAQVFAQKLLEKLNR